MTSIALNHPQISNDGPWTLGVKIGVPFVIVGALVLLACVVAFIRSFQYGSTDGYDCNWGTP